MLPAGFADVTAIRRSGVYVLLSRGEVVYVGQSVKLYARLATHIVRRGKDRGKRSRVPSIRFDQIWVRHCEVEELDEVEADLIERYRPEYNVRGVPKVPLDVLIQGLVYPLAPPTPERRSVLRR
jgi:excinuclease UvrABC nuclease subunit